MKKIFLLLFSLIMFTILIAGQRTNNQTESLRIVIGDSTIVDTFKIFNLKHYGNHVVGRIIIEPSAYTTGGFGILDTAEIIVKAVYYDGTTLIARRTLDSVKQTGVNALPCTLIVDTYNDSTLGLDRLEIYIQVRDTVDVVAVATFDVQINLIHTWAN